MNQPESRVSMRPIRFQQAIPILRIFDIDKAKAFYVDFLGFSVDWEHRFEHGLPLYMQISRGDLTLHLSEHHGDCTPGSTVFVIMNGLREFHQQISAKKYRNLRPGIQWMPWNAEVMEIIDPFGNRIRFNEYLRERKKETSGDIKSAKPTSKRHAKKKSRSRA
jgi:catechol 2,3-dioxygenase-like lactoylglutathione lyase family enzyme